MSTLKSMSGRLWTRNRNEVFFSRKFDSSSMHSFIEPHLVLCSSSFSPWLRFLLSHHLPLRPLRLTPSNFTSNCHTLREEWMFISSKNYRSREMAVQSTRSHCFTLMSITPSQYLHFGTLHSHFHHHLILNPARLPIWESYMTANLNHAVLIHWVTYQGLYHPCPESDAMAKASPHILPCCLHPSGSQCPVQLPTPASP